MNEARRLIYEDKKKIEEFDINVDGELNYLVYHNWLLTRKELREAQSDAEMERLMLNVFNDAYYICTVSLMHPKCSKKSRWFIQQANIPSLVMPLVYLYIKNIALESRELSDLLKLIEGDLDYYTDWKENHKKLMAAVKNFSKRISVSTFTRREFTPELLESIRWWSITKTFKAEDVRKCIGFNAKNLDEQKMMAKAIYDASTDFEYENGNQFYIDDDGNEIVETYDFSKTYQLCKDILDSDKYTQLLNLTACLEDILPIDIQVKDYHRGRPKINPKEIKACFQIKHRLGNLNARLSTFYTSLRGSFNPCGDKFLKPHKSSSSSISGV